MQEQKATKVTLYLPHDLHRQLKIRSAVEGEAMSAIAQKALDFYLAHSEVVEGLEAAYGQSYRVHNCPSCATSVVLQQGELVEMSDLVSPEAAADPVLDVKGVVAAEGIPGEEELLVC